MAMSIRTLTSSRFGLIASLRAFLPAISLSAQVIPAVIHLNIPSFMPGLFESILRAVPKKKQSHSKRRMRQLAGKALKDITALNKCPACGSIKRRNVLCEHCVETIKDMWRREQGAAGS